LADPRVETLLGSGDVDRCGDESSTETDWPTVRRVAGFVGAAAVLVEGSASIANRVPRCHRAARHQGGAREPRPPHRRRL